MAICLSYGRHTFRWVCCSISCILSLWQFYKAQEVYCAPKANWKQRNRWRSRQELLHLEQRDLRADHVSIAGECTSCAAYVLVVRFLISDFFTWGQVPGFLGAIRGKSFFSKRHVCLNMRSWNAEIHTYLVGQVAFSLRNAEILQHYRFLFCGAAEKLFQAPLICRQRFFFKLRSKLIAKTWHPWNHWRKILYFNAIYLI